MKPSLELQSFLKSHPTTKDNFEIVVTRYNEPLDWCKGLEHLVTVYNKGADDLPSSFTQIRVPNIGKGTETMFRHIVERYNTLAEVTFFAQGNVLDREDQPLYPLSYYQETGLAEARGVLTDSYDPPKSRYLGRVEFPNVRGQTLGQWRKSIGLPYRYLQEMWVRGDWIAVGRTMLRSKPRSVYEKLLADSQFERGIAVEEMWFWERTWWALLTSECQPFGKNVTGRGSL